MKPNEKFCPKCGLVHGEDANFCRHCGIPLDAKTTATEPAQDHVQEKQETPTRKETPVVVYEMQKSSGIVTFLSCIGLIFGLPGLLTAFVPFIGLLAKFICIPAMAVSALALMIALVQNAKKTFAIVAFTVSFVGIVLSYKQMSMLKSGIQGMQESTQRMQESAQRALGQGGAVPSPITAPQKRAPSVQGQRFVGIWEYVENGSTSYAKIIQSGRSTFLFECAGGIDEKGKLYFNPSTMRAANGKYVQTYPRMKMSNGSLVATFVSQNFVATHGTDTKCKIMLTPLPDGTLKYDFTYKIMDGSNATSAPSVIMRRSSRTE